MNKSKPVIKRFENYFLDCSILRVSFFRVLKNTPNGLRYQRLGREMLRNGKLPKLRNNLKKRAEAQPSSARSIAQLSKPKAMKSRSLDNLIH
jgi:hypothetical protein